MTMWTGDQIKKRRDIERKVNARLEEQKFFNKCMRASICPKDGGSLRQCPDRRWTTKKCSICGSEYDL